MRWIWIAVLVLAVGPLPTHAQDDVSIDITHVRDSVYMLTGAGGNIGLSIGDDGVFMVDDQFAPLTDRIKAAIATRTDKPIRFLINTHWHFDHTGGNENLGEDGVVIAAHHNVRKRLASGGRIEFFGRDVPASPDVALPVITYGKGVVFHQNGETIKVRHLPPAHTDGDSVVWFKSANVLHTGDLVFNGLYPFIDVSSGGSVDGVIAAVDRLVARADADTRVIPGHGPLTDRDGLIAYVEMLRSIRNRIHTLMQSGATQAQIVAAKPTRAFDAAWGGGFIEPDAFTRLVLSSLQNPVAPRKHQHGDKAHGHAH